MSAILFGLIKFTDIPGTKRAIMWVLADHANDQGVSWPNRATLSSEVGVGEKPLRDNLRALEQEGWLSMELGNGRGNPTRYFLNVSKLRTAAKGFDEAFPHEAIKGGSEREALERGVSDKGGHLEPLKGGTSFPKGWYPTFNEPSITIIEPSLPKKARVPHEHLGLTEDEMCKLRTRWSGKLTDLDERIEEALGHTAAKKWTNKYLGVNNWLRSAYDRLPAWQKISTNAQETGSLVSGQMTDDEARALGYAIAP